MLLDDALTSKASAFFSADVGLRKRFTLECPVCLRRRAWTLMRGPGIALGAQQLVGYLAIIANDLLRSNSSQGASL